MTIRQRQYVRKVEVTVESDNTGLVLTYDCIWHEGHWWIVSEWRQVHATRQKQPTRLLRPLAAWEAAGQDSEWMNPLLEVPKAALDGTPCEGYVVGVVDRADVPPPIQKH